MEQIICTAEADLILSRIYSAQKWFSLYVEEGMRQGRYANAVSDMIPFYRFRCSHL